MLHVMDGGRASPLYRHPVREAVEGYTVNRVYRISRIGLYRVYRVYRIYRIQLHWSNVSHSKSPLFPRVPVSSVSAEPSQVSGVRRLPPFLCCSTSRAVQQYGRQNERAGHHKTYPTFCAVVRCTLYPVLFNCVL